MNLYLKILLSESNYQGSIQAWKIFLIFGLCSSSSPQWRSNISCLWDMTRTFFVRKSCWVVTLCSDVPAMAMICESLVWMTFNRLITLLQHSDNEWIKYQFATEQQTWYVIHLHYTHSCDNVDWPVPLQGSLVKFTGPMVYLFPFMCVFKFLEAFLLMNIRYSHVFFSS